MCSNMEPFCLFVISVLWRGMFVILSPAWVLKKKNLLFVVPKDHAPDCVVLKTIIHLSIIESGKIFVSIYLHFSE